MLAFTSKVFSKINFKSSINVYIILAAGNLIENNCEELKYFCVCKGV